MTTSFRALSAYQIPEQILSTLAVRSIQAAAQPDIGEPSSKVSDPTPQKFSGGDLGCQTCPGVSFGTVEEQRGHFKTDWHRYNAKARLQGANAITAEKWDDMVEGESRSPRLRGEVA